MNQMGNGYWTHVFITQMQSKQRFDLSCVIKALISFYTSCVSDVGYEDLTSVRPEEKMYSSITNEYENTKMSA